jgi:hypothetical protein
MLMRPLVSRLISASAFFHIRFLTAVIHDNAFAEAREEGAIIKTSMWRKWPGKQAPVVECDRMITFDQTKATTQARTEAEALFERLLANGSSAFKVNRADGKRNSY